MDLIEIGFALLVAVIIAIYDYYLIRGHRKHVASILETMNAQHRQDMGRIHQEIMQAVSKEYPEKVIQYQDLINQITTLRQLALEGKTLLEETMSREGLAGDEATEEFFKRVNNIE